MSRKQLLIALLLLPLLSGCDAYLHKIPPATAARLEPRPAPVTIPREAAMEFLRYRQAYYQRDLVEQIEHLRRSALHDPGSGALRTRLAELYWYADEPDQAMRLCRQALTTSPDHCEAHMLLGQIASYYLDLDEAEGELRRAVACDPSLEAAWRQLVYLLSSASRDEEVLQVLLEYREHSQDEAWVARRLGQALEQLDRRDEAIEALKVAVELEPEDRDSLATILQAYQEADRMEEAVTFVESLVRRYPSSLLLREELVSLYAATGRYDDAVEQLISQYEQDPDNRDLYAVRSAGWLERLLRYDEAIDLLRKTLEEFPGDPHLTLRMAWVLEASGDVDGALEAFTSVDLDSAVGSIAVREHARVLEDLDRGQEAIEILQEATDRTGATVLQPELVVSLVRHQTRAGHFQEARENLERIRNEAPDLYALEKAELLWRMEELDRAVVLLQEEIDRAGVDPTPSLMLARIYRDEGLYEEGTEVLTANLKRLQSPAAYQQLPVGIYRTEEMRRLQIREFQLEVLIQLGFLQGLLEDRDGAVRSMRAALELDPDDVRALNYIGYTYAEADDELEQAEAMIRRALTLAPLDPAILDSLGWVLFRQGRFEEALDVLQMAQQRMPSSAVVWQHLAETYEALDRRGEAVEALELVLENVDEQDPEEVVAARRAEELLQQWRGDEP